MGTVLRHNLLIVLGTIAVLGMSACSQAKPDTPEPTGSGSPSAGPTSGAGSVPEVENPKNLKAITDACVLLTSEQLAQLGGGGAPDREKTMYGESKCTWSNDKFSTTIALNATTGTGPAEVAESDQSDRAAQPSVNGYPAAHIDKTTILCRVEVAVAKNQSIAVNYAVNSGDAPAMQKPCQYAERIAGEALENIPAA